MPTGAGARSGATMNGRYELPAESGPIIGRGAVIAAAVEQLDRGRLLTLTGTGGIGKSRLAMRIAHDVAATYRHGALRVDLTHVGSDEEQLVGALATALGILDNSERCGAARVIEHLRDKQVLLVLDNCEHLVDGSDDESLDDDDGDCHGQLGPLPSLLVGLLEGARSVRVLATSRASLRLDGERLLQVPPLNTHPDAPDKVSEATSLFLDQAAARGVRIARAHYPVVDTICRAVQGIPLAIRVAAGRLRAQRLHDIADDIATDPVAPLTSVLDASCRSLSAEETRMWAVAAVFRGGFRIRALEDVYTALGLDATPVPDLISALQDKSLIERADRNGHTRFDFLETVRLYGKRLSIPDLPSETIVRAHAEYHLTLSRRSAREWFSELEVMWMRVLSAEDANLRVALRWLVSAGRAEDSLAAAVESARSRADIFTGNLNSCRRRLTTALDDVGENHPRARLAALALCGWIASIQGKPELADTYLARCDRLQQDLDLDTAPTIVRFARAATVMLCETDLPRARESVDLLVALAADAASDPDSSTGDQHMIKLFAALAAGFYADPDHALALSHDVLADAEAHDAAWAISWAQWALALATFKAGNLDDALGLAQRALRTQYETEDTWGRAWSIWLSAILHAHLGDPATAAVLVGGARRYLLYADLRLAGLIPFLIIQLDADARCRRVLRDYDITVQTGLSMSYREIVELALASPATAAPPPGQGAHGLSAREHEVAILVARGLTNRAAGEKLGLSARTIESHLTRCFQKLGVSQREDVAEALIRQGRLAARQITT